MTETKKPDAKPADSGAEAERRRLFAMLAHPTWFFRSFVTARVFEWLVPFPLGYLHFLWRTIKHGESHADWKKSAGRVDDNVLMTLALAIYFVGWLVHVDFWSFQKVYAGDAAKLLFSGAFLLGTILSVSVALPGQSLAKLALGADPKFAFDFVMPVVWGFLCGVAGGLLMMFFPTVLALAGAHYFIPGAALFVALYGALMEFNAIIHTVRHYLFGMVLWSASIEKDARKGDRAQPEPERPNRNEERAPADATPPPALPSAPAQSPPDRLIPSDAKLTPTR